MDVETPPQSALMIVAHPDDELLWAGGTILLHPQWRWHIYTLTRASDPDRAPRFSRLLSHLGAAGAMADLDDGPMQEPLEPGQVQRTILDLVEGRSFDHLFTHGPEGEYTYHRRHVEVSHAVAQLWQEGRLHAGNLWLFAYEDGGRTYLPRPRADATVTTLLPPQVWAVKHSLVTTCYGFAPESWEAQATPRIEAFWRLAHPDALDALYEKSEVRP